ncbi:hypothetical protein [Luteimonas sp. e5]
MRPHDESRHQTTEVRLGHIGFLAKNGRLVLEIPHQDLTQERVKRKIKDLFLSGTIRSAICGCVQNGPSMYLRVRNGRLEICNLARGGELHSPQCDRFSAFAQIAIDLDRDRWRAHGLDRICAPPPIGRRHAAADTSHDRRPPSRMPVGTRTLGAGLLALIDASELNRFDPGTAPRAWQFVAGRFHDIASAHAAGAKAVQPIVLGLSASSRRLSEVIGRSGRVVVIGHIIGRRYTSSSVELRILGVEGSLRIDLKKWQYALRRATSRCVKSIFSGLPRARGKIIFAADIEKDRKGEIRVGAIGLVATTDTWIPVESSYELDCADRLASAGYKFTKDIYQPTSIPFRPDFRLHLSDGEDFILEVDGLTSEEYLMRKITVHAWLKEHMPNGHAIWRVNRGDRFPILPAP